MTPEQEREIDDYMRRRLKTPHRHSSTDTRWFAVIAVVAGAYVAFSELNYSGPSSSLTWLLFSLGVGIAFLGLAHLLEHPR